VRGLTLRLADKELTPASEGRQAVAAALPLLLEKGAPISPAGHCKLWVATYVLFCIVLHRPPAPLLQSLPATSPQI
jgi:hypothetical protein